MRFASISPPRLSLSLPRSLFEVCRISELNFLSRRFCGLPLCRGSISLCDLGMNRFLLLGRLRIRLLKWSTLLWLCELAKLRRLKSDKSPPIPKVASSLSEEDSVLRRRLSRLLVSRSLYPSSC